LPSGGEYVVETRRAAVELLEQGHGAWAIAKQLKVPRNTVVRWVGHYRRQGDEGLEPAAMKQTYSRETKVAAVEAFLGGAVKSRVMKDFEIRSDASLERWVRIYRKDGPEGLRPKPIGRPRKQPVPAAEETLEEKVQRLEMENAALKKLQALAARRRPRESR
jgi:transposase